MARSSGGFTLCRQDYRGEKEIISMEFHSLPWWKTNERNFHLPCSIIELFYSIV